MHGTTGGLRVEALENREMPAVALSVTAPTVVAERGEAVFQVTRTGDSGPVVRVAYATVDGTAIAGRDYVAQSGEVVLAGGQMSAEVRVPLLADDSVRPDRSFSLTLSSPASLDPYTFARSYPVLNPPDRVTTIPGLVTGRDGLLVSGGSGSSSLNFFRAEGADPLDLTLYQANGFNFPTYTAYLRDDRILYAVQDVNPNGAVYSFGVTPDANPPTFSLQTQAVTSGTFPTHFAWDNTVQWLLVPNAGDGSISVLPINPDGTLGAQATFTQNVGAGSEPGWVAFDRTNQYFYAALAGTNRIAQFHFDAAGGFIFANPVPYFDAGIDDPRSMEVLDVGGQQVLVVANAGSGTVSVLNLDPATGLLSAGLTIPVGGSPAEVRVGDVDGDGREDVIVSDPGNGTVAVLLNTTTAGGPVSFATPFTLAGDDPVSAALADVDGDGRPDLAVAERGAQAVSVYLNTSAAPTLARASAAVTIHDSPVHLTATGSPAGDPPRVVVRNADGSVRFDFLAYDPGFRGGVTVAVGDLNGDGVDDVITGAGVGGAPHVKVYDGLTGSEIASFFAYDPSFRGGVSVGAADVDGTLEIVTGAGPGGAPHVKAFKFDGLAQVASFFAYDASFRGGVNVATGDLDGDGEAELVLGAGAEGGPEVSVFDGVTGARVSQFFAGPSTDRGGVRLAVTDLDQNGSNELVARAAGVTKVYDPFTGADLSSNFTAAQIGGVFVG